MPILYIQSTVPRDRLAQGSKAFVDMALRKAGLSLVTFLSVAPMYGRFFEKKEGTKATYVFKPGGREKILAVLGGLINKYNPPAIIVQDEWTVRALVDNTTATLNQTRGSVYYVPGYNTPCIVLDKVFNYYEHINTYGLWLLGLDLGKVRRHATKRTRHEPKFTYEVTRTTNDLDSAYEFLEDCRFITVDIETFRGFITCIGFTGVKDGRMHTYVVPFFNPLSDTGAFWLEEDDEIYAWQVVRNIGGLRVLKIMQNGIYDSAYLIKFRTPMLDYLLDTSHLMHATYSDVPKRLDFLSSIFVDHYQYWKEDSKGVTGASEKRPATEEDLEQYWRYNALDCYYTFVCFRGLLEQISGYSWAITNYAEEISLQLGPGLASSMRGMLVDKQRQRVFTDKKLEEHAKTLADLRTMVADPLFNPNSNPEVEQLLYDMLGAKPVEQRGAKKQASRSVDQKVLKIVAAQHPLFARFIKQIQDTKQPMNDISKYGVRREYPELPNAQGKTSWKGLRVSKHGRFMFQISFSGTWTGRAASMQHMFNTGTNAQNIPETERVLMVADEGYVFFEVDYSQSDAFFVAGASGDKDMINTMKAVLDGEDSHLIHAAFFMEQSYDNLLARHKKKDPIISKKPGGLRDVFKRVVHGANFLMAGYTLFMTMGVENVINAAKAAKWDGSLSGHNNLAKFCQHLLDRYSHEKYPDLYKWQKHLPVLAKKCRNTLTTAFGRSKYFFGDFFKNKETQRQMASLYGQGGTAGNINRTLLEYYYESGMDGKQALFISQTHDSCLFMLRVETMHESAKKILTIMEKPVTIGDWTFHVPTEANIGLSWAGPGVLPYNEKLTYTEIVEADKKNDSTF